MGRKDSIPDDAPAPRLCELVKWAHFQGYGFNLHSEKGREGQFIGKIDPQSPAEACGLQEGDQIIEVNGVNTSNENHKQVVSRIKTHSDHASLLVVDAKAAEYYKKRNIVVNGSMPNVKHMKSAPVTAAGDKESENKSESTAEDSAKQTASQAEGSDEPPPPVPPKTDLASEEQSPAATPAEATSESEVKSETEVKPVEEKPAEEKSPDEKPAEKEEEEKTAESKPEEDKVTEKKPEEEDEPAEKPAEEKTPEASPSEGANRKSEKPSEKAPEKEAGDSKVSSPTIDTSLQVESGSERTQPSPAPSAGSTSTVESAKSAESGSTAAETDKFGLKLNMTAAEMREYLKSKKRHDPRNDNLTFKQRHQIVQNM
ncbi:Na(+)/H(+) exchange regulatory cofactor NHE-RF1-like [Amphibalanus amphitrite]|uniref:Na(+)/H(+) exchange regulatory cofactor NHE-RF1-like n=1 Tax=Amphibalanus amphitrite TaxID=1232801 RepID=UPI001C91BEBB|nr:Na(+)/H(+) exchange regulatory cofactor NHE-RF1-like [Amphibalanus amphitrite]